MLWHAKQTYRTSSSSEYQTTSPKASMNSGDGNLTSRPDRKRLDASFGKPWTAFTVPELVERGLRQSGVVRVDQPDVIEFYVILAGDDGRGMPIPKDLRKVGKRLNSGELKGFGMRGNTSATWEFLATLNDRGLSNPIEAANMIYQCVSKPAHWRHQMRSSDKVLGKRRTVTILKSNAAFGPCAVVAAFPDRVRSSQCPLFPLDGCSHPEQCCCLQRSIYEPDD